MRKSIAALLLAAGSASATVYEFSSVDGALQGTFNVDESATWLITAIPSPISTLPDIRGGTLNSSFNTIAATYMGHEVSGTFELRALDVPMGIDFGGIGPDFWIIRSFVSDPVYEFLGLFLEYGRMAEPISYSPPPSPIRFVYGIGRRDGVYVQGEMAPLAAPVPEPQTWIMLAVGLGVVAVVARRRRPD